MSSPCSPAYSGQLRESRERDDTFEYCELGEAGSLKIEDQLWEGREPHQVVSLRIQKKGP